MRDVGLKYEDWLAEFLKGKEEVPSLGTSDKFAVHSVHRYLDNDHHLLWEIAVTYTGRLLVRSGKIGPDGITVEWNEWVTRHDVELPKSR